MVGLPCTRTSTTAYWRYGITIPNRLRALRTLQSEGLATDYSLSILTDEPDGARHVGELALVDSTRSALDLVPDEQEETGYVLEDAQQILWNLLDEDTETVLPPTMAELQHSIDALLESIASAQPTPETARLAELLTQVRAAPPQLLTVWQPAVVDYLVGELAWLRRALVAQPFEFDDLPPVLQRNMRGESGVFLTVVNPAKDLSDVTELNRFIDAVQAEQPQATGRPVIEWGLARLSWTLSIPRWSLRRSESCWYS